MTHRLHSRERCLFYNSARVEGDLRMRRAYAVPLEIVDHSHPGPQLETKHSISTAKLD